MNNCSKNYLTRYIGEFRVAYRETLWHLPFETVAICILPDHFHCIMRLPEHDRDFSRRIQNLKINFSKRLPEGIRSPNTTQSNKRESGIWQSRFWEHAIRNERDLENHIHYIYYNPVKHGHAEQVCDWPYSSFHQDVASGLFNAVWGSSMPSEIQNLYND
ncbi:REP-associated tyrosine transposase [Neisseria canis]|uniref:REP-associated tyrosine transposase n=1 Tax=Neisseria canis TaxID=493 RepID=UPI00146A9EBB